MIMITCYDYDSSYAVLFLHTVNFLLSRTAIQPKWISGSKPLFPPSVSCVVAHGLECARRCMSDMDCSSYSLIRDTGSVNASGTICILFGYNNSTSVASQLQLDTNYVTYFM